MLFAMTGGKYFSELIEGTVVSKYTRPKCNRKFSPWFSSEIVKSMSYLLDTTYIWQVMNVCIEYNL